MPKEKLKKEHFEIILEDINSKINLILKKDYVTKSDLKNTEDRLMEKIESNSLAIKANSFAIKALNNKIDDVEIRLTNKIDDVDQKLSKRIDGVEIRLDGLDRRMDGLDQKMDRVETNLSNKIDEVKEVLIHHISLPVH
ncbi:hypothetical protein A2526_00110 [candidate division WOR-1 bacterium RIFOXYD2_FULL_36_8]|uniref:t-SNARE coiled-coil homology domain-containing protein n=1 Tax=candidate division WOR-1 bacterium RIFOXYB2_FULL_36_35 TaxID=1802578 RepID=A0A1F4S2L4_UNCSA|nr:MAG: hypothetical protein A2230_04655 [candidate division WOR-1 bacterium RIFOXYA2_FULL_36_21]OGC14684.1 MAG: hypothetical protein A2290_01385 [candidate division WOR-1 bacterium RIFOXYB2_FULL_36_35]OGC19702.1 MAG: hypothetical protein A2282_03110 [candidate division WOR-1 bacterium RIFOXYA12_FULL_36_13]OGC39209.1 MAG: hypothetical protein A2526_00110 [candidate division WOR-1 bacterium RIFOXYD2_FULL_36_8]